MSYNSKTLSVTNCSTSLSVAGFNEPIFLLTKLCSTVNSLCSLMPLLSKSGGLTTKGESSKYNKSLNFFEVIYTQTKSVVEFTVRLLKTNEGLLLPPFKSVNGNRTNTTSPCSNIAYLLSGYSSSGYCKVKFYQTAVYSTYFNETNYYLNFQILESGWNRVLNAPIKAGE